MNMLTSSNQYLRPEYLSPLPTTLDAKKSPLALLAQTCSNIGADNPNNKPIIPGLEKAKDHHDGHKKEKSSSSLVTNNSSLSSSSSSSSMSSIGGETDKSSFKPYESGKSHKEDHHGDLVVGGGNSGKKTPMSKTSSPAVGVHSPSPCSGKVSPAGSESGRRSRQESTKRSDTPKNETPTSSSLNLNSTGDGGTSSQNTLTGLGYGSSLGLDLARLDPSSLSAAKDSLNAMSHLYKHGLSGALNSLAAANCAGCSPVPGHVPVDAATTPHGFPSSLGSPGSNGGASGLSSPLKPGFSVGSALSPYVGYARVKTAAGGTTLVPVCRDPFCTNCQFSMQSAQFSTTNPSCPSGCTQCNHDRLAQPSHHHHHHLGSSGLHHGLGPSMIPGIGGSLGGSLGSSIGGSPGGSPSSLAYHHAMLPRPNVCSWMVGDTYCGKRFTTSEELLQHLRTHTNLSGIGGDNTSAAAAAAASLSLMSQGIGGVPSTSSVAAWNAACHLHYTTAASLNSQAAGLRRAYPTSLSPVSSLTAAGRYHPYKPQLPTFPGGPLPPLPHPGLGLYYSPYGLFGQRLGPPVHP